MSQWAFTLALSKLATCPTINDLLHPLTLHTLTAPPCLRSRKNLHRRNFGFGNSRIPAAQVRSGQLTVNLYIHLKSTFDDPFALYITGPYGCTLSRIDIFSFHIAFFDLLKCALQILFIKGTLFLAGNRLIFFATRG